MALAIGVFIGVILGLTGAGGSVFAVPLLLLLLGTNANDAIGISLGAVSAAAMLGAFKQRNTLLRIPAALLISGGVIAAPFGQWLGSHTPPQVLVFGFCGIALVIAYWMWQQAQQQPDQSQYVRSTATPSDADQSLSCRLSRSGQFELKPRCISGLVIGGLGIGFISGLLGVGGGFLIIPLLRYLSDIAMPKAIATSLAVIAIVSLSGFISHCLQTPLAQMAPLVWVLTGAIAGMLISQPIGKKLAGATLQKLVAVLLVIVIIVTIADQLHH